MENFKHSGLGVHFLGESQEIAVALFEGDQQFGHYYSCSGAGVRARLVE